MAIALFCLGCLVLPQSGEQVLKLGGDRIQVTERWSLGPRVLSGPPVEAAVGVTPPPVTGPLGSDGAEPCVWRARIRIASELRVGAQRMAMSAAAVGRVRVAFAKFQQRVFTLSRGRVRIAADIALLTEPLVVPDRAGPFWLTPTRASDYGISGVGVDSVFLVFPPGRRDLAMLAGTYGGDVGPDGAGSTGLAWVARREPEMVRVILHEWLHQVEWLARTKFGMPWLPGSHDREDLGFVDEDRLHAALLGHYLSAEFWRRARIRRSHGVSRLPGDQLYRWANVADDPWRRLPLLDAAGLAARTGYAVRLDVGRGFVEARREAGGIGGDRDGRRRLDLARESALLLPVRGSATRSLVIVRGDRADLFGRFLRGAKSRASVVGVLLPLRAKRRIDNWQVGGTATPLMVFETEFDQVPNCEVEMLALPDDCGLRELPDVMIEFRARSGPAAVVKSGAAFVCRVRNRTATSLTTALEVGVPPGVVVDGLPRRLTLVAGETKEFPCRVLVGADRAAGELEIRLMVRGEDRALGQVRERVHVAVGRDFLRLGFEGGVLALRAARSTAVASGEWTVSRGRGVIGAGCLRISDGGGTRFGRHHVMLPSPLSYDTEQFPYLVFHFRAKPQPGARLAINVAVGSRLFSIPLVGEFERAWDDRRRLSRGRVELDGAWHRVTYDLDAALDAVLGEGGHRVASIDFGDTRAKCSNRFTGDDAWTFELDEFAVVRSVGETGATKGRGW